MPNIFLSEQKIDTIETRIGIYVRRVCYETKASEFECVFFLESSFVWLSNAYVT